MPYRDLWPPFVLGVVLFSAHLFLTNPGATRPRPKSNGERDNSRGRSLRQLLDAIVRPLFDHPERVEVSEVQNRDFWGPYVLFVVKVASGDRANVEGRRGATADAIRTILKAAGARDGERCELDLVDENDLGGGLS